ncbi:ArgP/LysG family DNA-binding transcriptional regulator [Rhizobium leguminosarum bv. viciae]|uniref:LysR family transcriptional regulator n=2 Tax=Rhizobium TaxID=379 RepID=A0A179BHE8_RHILE|nr:MULTISPECIES: LysR family transcriptional regulator ArgP [Rhizobium]NKJ71842.1 ArgP/LysG family DNA-binding transcriptional regulator [Rhizobium leguminosarum bv. viciae]API55093.1 transcriptional regulator ArgP [Rhizobium leguminosarum]NKQ69792.1 LysR family transcriptional regulator ArgP [Rhizobium ruizarguesonis]NKQ77796.1 LysR family transcriptional regulator ArgP [Rhizobium ruizarguesonis]OAP91128.1 LysR family transcriptional regulator [Rhizobium leguminosarum]
MLDYSALRALAAVVQTGSFEKAAGTLNVTPSAVSQRVKNLEERMGIALVVRGNPCVATEQGQWVCRHVENVGLLERDLYEHLPSLAPSSELIERVTIHLATNADSLGTWFLEALSICAKSSNYLLDIVVDDEGHTADWLERGRVIAAVTGSERLVPGCRRTALGSLRYRATASPEFVERYLPKGVSGEALRTAPALTFNQKDKLQDRWIAQTLGEEVICPTHFLPSTHAFVDASVAGIGWGMNPDGLVRPHLQKGTLVELIPDKPLDIPLFWQINRLAADRFATLTDIVIAVAKQHLV